MMAEYDFSKGKRGALLSSKGKTRITIYIDDTVLEEFRSRAEEAGTGYQTMMNDALKEYLSQSSEKVVTESMLRRILQEEFPKIAQLSGSPS
jgi:metal-responsive CopG/Arc/MetJ family transcriptional regulator